MKPLRRNGFFTPPFHTHPAVAATFFRLGSVTGLVSGFVENESNRVNHALPRNYGDNVGLRVPNHLGTLAGNESIGWSVNNYGEVAGVWQEKIGVRRKAVFGKRTNAKRLAKNAVRHRAPACPLPLGIRPSLLLASALSRWTEA